MGLRHRVENAEKDIRELREHLRNSNALRGAMPCDLCGSVSGLRMKIDEDARSASVGCADCDVWVGGGQSITTYGAYRTRYYDRSKAVANWNSTVVTQEKEQQ